MPVFSGTAAADRLLGTSQADELYGLAGDDALYGFTGDDLLDGGTGQDGMAGGLGNDTYVVDAAGDVVTEAAGEGTDTVRSSVKFSLGANVENLVLLGTAAINGFGNSLANTITGNAGANTLVGGLGDDVMAGGGGNDTYDVDAAGDRVIEAAGAGIDAVRSSVTFSLGANVENLVLLGTADINGFGNSLANTITGNAGANTLHGGLGDDRLVGGAGADRLLGGGGNDIYEVDNTCDVATEAVGEGADTVRSSVKFSLGANVENLVLTGVSNINGFGNSLNNVISGNAGANLLVGSLGDDVMAGGGGNDTYDVDAAGDRVMESVGEGTDTVRSSVKFSLSANVENLILLGAADINGFGNSLANKITGNAGANILVGGLGDDVMVGGGGDDTYDVDSAGDDVVEAANEGRDLVRTAISYQLDAYVEDLLLLGTADVNGTGNVLNNTIRGNAGGNILNGGAGDDILIGGDGNDVYEILTYTHSLDLVFEEEGGGIDLVVYGLTFLYYIGDNIENITVVSNGSVAGNDFDNVIMGSESENDLLGGNGNDSIIGGGGADSLIGGSGDDIIRAEDDVYEINGGDGNDNITTENNYDAFSWGIFGGNGNDRITTGSGVVVVYGDAGNDIIESNMYSILGGDGSDIINAGEANNMISGGRDDDHLQGGFGQDQFIYFNTQNGVDTIVDFKPPENDKLVFQGLLHGAFSYRGAAAFTASGNSEARFVGGQVLVDTDGNGAADITINLTGITDALQLHTADFVLS